MIEKEIQNKLDDACIILKDTMELCFEHLYQNPNDTKKILSNWKKYGDNVYREFIAMSEKYGNNVVGKELTKMIIFR